MDIIFYNVLFSLVQHIPKRKVLIIDGDMNSQLGKNGNDSNDSPNRNKEYLVDFFIWKQARMNKTKFESKEEKLRAYTYPKNYKAQLD